MLWHLKIDPAPDAHDAEGRRLGREAAELGIAGPWHVRASRGFLVEGGLSGDDLRRACETLLVDRVVERYEIRRPGEPDGEVRSQVHVMPRPGVTDPEGETARAVLRDLGFAVDECRTIRTYHVEGPAEALPDLIARVLSNGAVEHAVLGPLAMDRLGQGKPYRFRKVVVPIGELNDEELVRLSREGQLALSLDEMKAIRSHFAGLGREPTDCELETLAQTWSEHCSHKTLRGRIDLDGVVYENLLKETIFRATQELDLDWLVSVFADNAGVVRFDDHHDVCIKVETHNHPSAIDPYGGANTGLGGVIRDVMGTGLAAKPIANTDVFCVGPPETHPDALPPGVLHPRRVLEGVVAGVRDYGNRMGIPTVNGALVVDPHYLANPLVFCGTVGVLPRGMSTKSVEPGDRIVALGGRTGRDGIHGATFSSLDLSADSDSVSGGAVQIGNAITEKMVLDVLLQARDLGLFRSVTDCGAGGFSSAVGEMGAATGAEVDLERAPLKYEGLSYTEVWISEAQERMVLAVPPERWPELKAICEREGVEATDLGRFVATGRLTLRYQGEVVADLAMDFLHEGRPRVARKATFQAPVETPIPPEHLGGDFNADLLAILRHWDVASKEWIIRQYDHEVQARTVLKPLVGAQDDGPGDAAVISPVRGSNRGLSISCGINPRWGRRDPYGMAICVIDEAIRNAVAVGADPDRIALLDNFCWGNPERPETLGSLAMAALGCRDGALAYKAPFISGKDSLYNEYNHEGRSLAIPPTLLITAIGQVPDVRRCVTMDLKQPGNVLLLAGTTRNELGGSIWSVVRGVEEGRVPFAQPAQARELFLAVHRLMGAGLVASCHDASDGGIAAALAEMAMAGGWGVRASVENVRSPVADLPVAARLFAESPSRLILEVDPARIDEILDVIGDLPFATIGEVVAEPRLTIYDATGDHAAVDLPLAALKSSWRRPLHEAP